MKKSISAAIAATVMLIASTEARSENATKPEPAFRLLLENNKITIIESRLVPGAQSVLQERPPRAIYYLGPGQLKYTDFDDNSNVRDFKAGETEWREREMVGVENTGSSEIRLLLIIPK